MRYIYGKSIESSFLAGYELAPSLTKNMAKGLRSSFIASEVYFQSGWERACSQLGTRYKGQSFWSSFLACTQLVSILTKNTSSASSQLIYTLTKITVHFQQINLLQLKPLNVVILGKTKSNKFDFFEYPSLRQMKCDHIKRLIVKPVSILTGTFIEFGLCVNY